LSKLIELEQYEDSLMAPCAMKHAGTTRIYPESSQNYRTAFQRDRDRVIHSKAFRRLGYKTQVFVNSEGDNYRTRLTHSIEVSQISRSIAMALKLNRDFAECLALAHDLGHTPFGHSGQETLQELMKQHGGFEHNCQSLRIVSELETRYLNFNGLNLTRATLMGIMKHGNVYACDETLQDLRREKIRQNPVLEAELVDLCDKIAYIHHDLEDGLDSGIIEVEELLKIDTWKDIYYKMESQTSSDFRQARMPVRIRSVIRHLLNISITDLIETSHKHLSRIQPANLDVILYCDRKDYPVRFSVEMDESLNKMRDFLNEKLYQHPDVMKMSRRGKAIIEALFKEYVKYSEIMPAHIQKRIKEYGLQRIVCDYISGMTDRYALKEYRYLRGI